MENWQKSELLEQVQRDDGLTEVETEVGLRHAIWVDIHPRQVGRARHEHAGPEMPVRH